MKLRTTPLLNRRTLLTGAVAGLGWSALASSELAGEQAA